MPGEIAGGDEGEAAHWPGASTSPLASLRGEARRWLSRLGWVVNGVSPITTGGCGAVTLGGSGGLCATGRGGPTAASCGGTRFSCSAGGGDAGGGSWVGAAAALCCWGAVAGGDPSTEGCASDCSSMMAPERPSRF